MTREESQWVNFLNVLWLKLGIFISCALYKSDLVMRFINGNSLKIWNRRGRDFSHVWKIFWGAYRLHNSALNFYFKYQCGFCCEWLKRDEVVSRYPRDSLRLSLIKSYLSIMWAVWCPPLRLSVSPTREGKANKLGAPWGVDAGAERCTCPPSCRVFSVLPSNAAFIKDDFTPVKIPHPQLLVE